MGTDIRTDCDIDPNESTNILDLLAEENTQASPQSSCKNDIAAKNIADISVTRDTSHGERSQLKDVADANISDMSVTADTSHIERSPLKDVAHANI